MGPAAIFGTTKQRARRMSIREDLKFMLKEVDEMGIENTSL